MVAWTRSSLAGSAARSITAGTGGSGGRVAAAGSGGSAGSGVGSGERQRRSRPEPQAGRAGRPAAASPPWGSSPRRIRSRPRGGGRGGRLSGEGSGTTPVPGMGARGGRGPSSPTGRKPAAAELTRVGSSGSASTSRSPWVIRVDGTSSTSGRATNQYPWLRARWRMASARSAGKRSLAAWSALRSDGFRTMRYLLGTYVRPPRSMRCAVMARSIRRSSWTGCGWAWNSRAAGRSRMRSRKLSTAANGRDIGGEAYQSVPNIPRPGRTGPSQTSTGTDARLCRTPARRSVANLSERRVLQPDGNRHTGRVVLRELRHALCVRAAAPAWASSDARRPAGRILADDADIDSSALVVSRDPFHGAFHFCLECRRFTCPSCWDAPAGFCRSCAMATGSGEADVHEDLEPDRDRGTAPVRARQPDAAGHPRGVAATRAAARAACRDLGRATGAGGSPRGRAEPDDRGWARRARGQGACRAGARTGRGGAASARGGAAARRGTSRRRAGGAAASWPGGRAGSTRLGGGPVSIAARARPRGRAVPAGPGPRPSSTGWPRRPRPHARPPRPSTIASPLRPRPCMPSRPQTRSRSPEQVAAGPAGRARAAAGRAARTAGAHPPHGPPWPPRSAPMSRPAWPPSRSPTSSPRPCPTSRPSRPSPRRSRLSRSHPRPWRLRTPWQPRSRSHP